MSDKVALEELARRHDRDLNAEGIRVVAIGGAQAIGRFLAEMVPVASAVRLAGLYDVAQEAHFRRALTRAGHREIKTRVALERLGFFACDRDLEDELIRAVGTTRVQEILGAQGDLRSFRRFQQQPAQRGRSTQGQLWRFMGTHSGRKAKYARILIDNLALESVPRPLDALLRHLDAGRPAAV